MDFWQVLDKMIYAAQSKEYEECRLQQLKAYIEYLLCRGCSAEQLGKALTAKIDGWLNSKDD